MRYSCSYMWRKFRLNFCPYEQLFLAIFHNSNFIMIVVSIVKKLTILSPLFLLSSLSTYSSFISCWYWILLSFHNFSSLRPSKLSWRQCSKHSREERRKEESCNIFSSSHGYINLLCYLHFFPCKEKGNGWMGRESNSLNKCTQKMGS